MWFKLGQEKSLHINFSTLSDSSSVFPHWRLHISQSAWDWKEHRNVAVWTSGVCLREGQIGAWFQGLCGQHLWHGGGPQAGGSRPLVQLRTWVLQDPAQ